MPDKDLVNLCPPIEPYQVTKSHQTADIQASKLMRIRSNCCLYGEPEAYGGKGRPKKHGRQFKINDESTWWPTDATVEINDPKLGLIRVSQW
ncbi:hypothetical protein C789_1765 [Microcystis aeruginosa FACHB-905 = DIANCHI905]|nr:hypothetical protein C789_1765 [Microcystis aeruginosa FACHB-905 = DIANCHI905]